MDFLETQEQQTLRFELRKYLDEDEAVAIANGTHGLAAYTFTASIARAHRMARRLDAGTVSINTVA